MFTRTTLAAALAATVLGAPALAQQATVPALGKQSDCVARLEEQVRSDRRFDHLAEDRQMRAVVEGARSFAAKLDQQDLNYSEGCGALLNAMNVVVDEYIQQKGDGGQAKATPSREEIKAEGQKLTDANLVVDFATMVGVDVMNYKGQSLGQTRGVLIHGNDRPTHLLVQSASSWEKGGEKSAVAIPFERVMWHPGTAMFYVDVSEQAFKKAPEFARAGDWSVEKNNQWYQKHVQ